MKKIIVRTAVKTGLIILGVLIIIFAVFNFGFPQYMASAFENMGNYSIASSYACTVYKRTGDINDLTRLVDDSILAQKDKYILQYGEELLNKDGFDDVCTQKDEEIAGMDYKQFIGGKVAVAYYDNGNFAKAQNIALTSNGTTSFRSGNALIALAERIVDKGDKKNNQTLAATLGGIQPQESAEQELLNNVIQNLQQI